MGESVITTGFEDLDGLIGGFHPGDLVVIGSLPGVGKSALVQNFASHVTFTLGIPSLIYPMEEPAREVIYDVIASISSVDVSNVRNGTCTHDEVRRVRAASLVLDMAPLHVVDHPMIDIGKVVEKSQAAAALHDVGMFVVDSLQWLGNPLMDSSMDAICRDLKRLAVDTNTVVVVASHLDRRVMTSPDRPRVEDLCEAGAVLPHADVVMVLDRPDFHDEWSARGGEADLIVGKNVHGGVGVVTLVHQLDMGRFVGLFRG